MNRKDEIDLLIRNACKMFLDDISDNEKDRILRNVLSKLSSLDDEEFKFVAGGGNNNIATENLRKGDEKNSD